MEERGQSILEKDGVPLTVGGGVFAFSSLADLATTAQQVGMILGAMLVFVTLLHRIYIFWKDTKRD
jgi:hypothetical protein